MKFKLKELSALEKELTSLEEQRETNLPMILVDTGALIDIEQSVRNYSLSHKKELNSNHLYVKKFLSIVRNEAPLIITPHVFAEITNHAHCNRNGHTKEIEYDTFKYVQSLVNESTDFLARARTKASLDEARYDVYWATKNSCKDNNKKNEEGFSDADKDLLTNAARLSCSHIINEEKKFNINPVVIFSPDQHIEKGVNFINEFLSCKYPNIINISTRYRK